MSIKDQNWSFHQNKNLVCCITIIVIQQYYFIIFLQLYSIFTIWTIFKNLPWWGSSSFETNIDTVFPTVCQKLILLQILFELYFVLIAFFFLNEYKLLPFFSFLQNIVSSGALGAKTCCSLAFNKGSI